MPVNPYGAPVTSESARTDQECFVDDEVHRVLGADAQVRAYGYVLEMLPRARAAFRVAFVVLFGLLMIPPFQHWLTLLLLAVLLVINFVQESVHRQDILLAVTERCLVLVAVPWPGSTERLRSERVEVIPWSDVASFERGWVDTVLRIQVSRSKRRFEIPNKPYVTNPRRFVGIAKAYVSEAASKKRAA